MALTCVSVIFEIGHEAFLRNKKTPQGFTHDWELFIRGADNADIHYFVDKVIFHLHESFHNPKRVIKEPPYIVRESGYAGFSLSVEIYLKSKAEPTKIRFKYYLNLQESGPPISNVVREKYVFNNPPEDLRRKLIRGGGVGVGEESASGSHSNHMAALSSIQTDTEHKNSVNKTKSSPLDANAGKKSKKENTPKNEEKLSASDPFSIFGQPINTSKIPLSKPNSKLISDKVTQPEKQAHSSKPSKPTISSHKDKDKERDKEKEKDRDKDKEKTKEREKEKDKSSIKKSKDESMKKEKSKDDKSKVLKSSKEDSKKNSYHEDKPKEKPTEKTEKEVKIEKKDKEKKHKEEKKLKSKEKHKNNEKKENIDVKENYGERAEKAIVTKDENVNKEEKKSHKVAAIAVEEKEEKMDKSKEKATEPKNLYSNGNVNNVSVQSVVNNSVESVKKEEKHKHHKHKKDKSKKDSKRDKEEKKDRIKESKESKEKAVPPPPELPKSTIKSDSPKRMKKPLNALFEELSDKSDSDTSGLDDEPVTNSKAPSKEPSPEVTNLVKEEPNVCIKQEEPIKEEKIETPTKKKSKKSSDDKEAKKRKRKSKDKEENIAVKVSKYESRSSENDVRMIDVQEPTSDSRQTSVSPVSENRFTNEYVTKLRELQRKIMSLEDNSGLQKIVQVVAETGQYEITTRTFDFDLCTLDESIVQRLLDFFVP